MRVYATDFDGTVTYKGVSDELRAAIARWQAAGNLFGVVTGRPYLSMIKAIKEENFPVDFVVANNGAVIVTYEGGEENFRYIRAIDIADACALLDFFAGEEHHFCRIDSARTYFNHNHVPAYEVKDGCLNEGGNVYPEVTEITVDYPDLSASLEAAERVKEKFCGRLRAVPPGTQSIDCMCADVSKSAGIKKLIELLGISPEAIYTTGDSPNDLDMLVCPDFEGYAVENAVPVVKETVGRTVPEPLCLLRRILGE